MEEWEGWLEALGALQREAPLVLKVPYLCPLSYQLSPLSRSQNDWFIGTLVHWLNVKCQISNVICQMSNVKNQMLNIKCQMSIRLNFCRIVPPEFLRSFFMQIVFSVLNSPFSVGLSRFSPSTCSLLWGQRKWGGTAAICHKIVTDMTCKSKN